MSRKREKNRFEVIENDMLSVDPTPRQVKLSTIRDCRFEMARVYRDARAGYIDISDGTRLIYMLSQIGKMIESSDIEKRIEVLEHLNHGKLQSKG